MRFRRKTAFLPLLFLWIILSGCGPGAVREPPGQTIQPREQVALVPEKTAAKDVRLEDENVGGLKESQVLEKIRGHAAKLDIAARDAVLDARTWEPASKESGGQSVDVEATMSAVFQAAEGGNVRLVIRKTAPSVTSAMLEKNIVRIGSYTTDVIDRRRARINNIDLAAGKLDYYKLQPGDEFSFNRIVGKRTSADGYEEAPIIIRTKDGPKKKQGIGGGICQLSTTLYNAVEETGMRITERHMHSKEVPYVQKGEDATVSYGSADLKFVNTRSYPVMLRVFNTRSHVTVYIYENRNLVEQREIRPIR